MFKAKDTLLRLFALLRLIPPTLSVLQPRP